MSNRNSIAAVTLVIAACSQHLGASLRTQDVKHSPDEGTGNDDGIMLLQMRAGVLKRSEPLAEGEQLLNMLGRSVTFKESVSLLTHAGDDCWDSCGQKGGYCDWCGTGNMCCRQDFDENPSECANITSYRPMVKGHQCVASQATYAIDAKHMCGACGEENDLHVGVGGQNFDAAPHASAVEVCGAVCDEHAECGGFSHSVSLQKCFYRRTTSCQRADNADRDCYTKAGTRPGHLMTANYIRDAGRRCGACGDSNNLMLGVDHKPFDNVTKDDMIKVCGAKCNNNRECGGFNFVESLGQCQYRKVTSCQVSQDSDNDCFTKVMASQVGDSTKQQLTAQAKDLQAKLKQREVALKSKEADALRLQTALAAQSKMWGEEEVTAESDGATHGSHSANASDLSSFGNGTGEHGPMDEARLSGSRQEVVDSKQSEAGNALSQNVSGASARLDEAGYSSVVSLWNVSEMELFIRRVVSDVGCSIVDDGGLKGFVPFYSMENAQTLEGLKAELQSISTADHSAGKPTWIVPGAGADGQQELDNATVSNGVPEQESMMEADSGVRYHSGDLLAETSDVAASLWRVPRIWWPGDLLQHIKDSAQISSSVGADATLDEAGYAEVVAQGNATDITMFMRRSIEDMGCKVTDEGGLEGFIPFYGKDSGQNYASLRAELTSVSQRPGAWLAPHKEGLLEQASTRAEVLAAIEHLAAHLPSASLHINGEQAGE